MNEKQLAFCRAYAQNPDAKAAAIAAGYSESYAAARASKMLEKPHIVTEIKRLRAVVNQRAEKTATDVVNEYATIAFTDRVDFLKPHPEFPEQWTFKSPDELTKEQRACVADVNIRKIFKENEDGSRTFIREEYDYQFLDKMNALQQMGRHYGIFDDKLRLSSSSKNPFANATPEQLERLKSSFIKTMTEGDGVVIEHQTGEPVNGSG